MNAKRFFGSMLLAIAAGIAAVLVYTTIDQEEPTYIVQETPGMQYVKLPPAETVAPTDFIVAAEAAVDAVVHVKTKAYREGSGNPFYDFFFGYRDQGEPAPVLGYGSGVILRSDGYIITNNHVIEGSEEVEVILNDKRSFDAQILGTDPTTDLAVLKIRENNLPFLTFGNSDDLRLGEWVLAVGNPYNLTSTVTAGIVSAKARNINILRGEELSIESFIQTDAAVNPGNSGGALVNLQGKLVGINTAIASPTGSYTGYSFAVPVSLVKKVMDDLLEYGAVQRALLGISIRDLNADLAKELGIHETYGVYVAAVNVGSSAEEAGLKAKDIIIAIDDIPVKNVAELQEHVARNRPGDKIRVTFLRDGNEKIVTATLKNIMGEERMYSRNSTMEIQGASITEIEEDLKKKLDLDGGVQLNDIGSGKWKEAGIQNGFIITSIDKREIKTINDLMGALANKTGGILIGGVYPDGEEGYYGIKWD